MYLLRLPEPLPWYNILKIRLCENNKGKGKLLRRLSEEFPEVDVKIKSCIKQCGACREMPTATLNKKKVTAKDVEELYKKLCEAIQSKG